MNTKHASKLHLAQWLLISLFLCMSTYAARQPNFVLIMADDLGYGDVGYQGSDVPTPNIDSIAAGGVRITDGYVTCPVCAPSRAGMLTGRYQQSFGFWDNTGPYRLNKDVEPGVPTDLAIISERLKELGYTTGLFGKTHDGTAEAMMPFNRWDDYYGFNNGASNFLGDMNRKHNPIFRNKTIDSNFYEDRGINKNTVIKKGVIQRDSENYLTDQLGDHAARFINENKDRPFLCYVPFNAIHGPFQATKETFAKYADQPDHKRALVMAMLDSMDANIGKVLKALKDNQLMHDTIIIFLSDNGGHEASPNDPLRGKKGTFWEGGLRVPFCIQWEGKLAPGSIYTKPIISLDIMPTMIEAAGGTVEADWKLDGVNLLPYISGRNLEAPHEVLYWVWGPRKAIRMGDYKAVSMNNGKNFELYNLAQDISESTDLSRQHPEKLENMTQQHAKWESTLMPQLWGWNSKLGNKDPNFGKPEPYHDPKYQIK